jgi:hypothetical protein
MMRLSTRCLGSLAVLAGLGMLTAHAEPVAQELMEAIMRFRGFSAALSAIDAPT